MGVGVDEKIYLTLFEKKITEWAFLGGPPLGVTLKVWLTKSFSVDNWLLFLSSLLSAEIVQPH